MQKVKAVLVGVVCALFFASSASALVIDFEDLYSGVEEYDSIPAGYQGLQWGAAAYYLTDNLEPGTGYQVGTIGDAALFSAFRLDVGIMGLTEDFLGAYLTAGVDASEKVTVEGFKGSHLTTAPVFSSEITVFNDAATWFDFNFADIDSIWFRPHGNQIVIDDLTFGAVQGAEASPVPEPSTLVLLGAGFVGLVLGCRRKMKN